MPCLRITVEEAGQSPTVHLVDSDEVVVGRSPACDLVLDRPFISGRHLRILGGVVVHDLGSTNGTLIDGVPVDRPELIRGRLVHVGGMDLALRLSIEERSTTRAADEDSETGTAPIDLLADAIEPPIPEPVREPTPPAVPPAAPPAMAPSGPPPGPGPEEAPQEIPRRVPARAPELVAEDDAGATALLDHLIRHDAKAEEPRVAAPLCEFFTLEAFRFLRDVETIISRMAGELAGRSTNETVLPSAAGNVMRLLADIQAVPDDGYQREQFLEHLSELRRWLVESLTAYQRASVRLVEDIRSSLGILELGREAPMPKLHRAFGLQEVVLWKRAQKKLQDLTPDVIAERLDELARSAASEAFEDGN